MNCVFALLSVIPPLDDHKDRPYTFWLDAEC
jgi:hypothetical protein